MDKRAAVIIFRDHLKEVIRRSGLSRSQFARKVGVERSTLTQLLSDKTVRLPRSATLVAIATDQQVSVDWLLGLSQNDEATTQILPSLEVAEGAWGPADERLSNWHREAVGYKIRYVPSSLPDLLKTDDVIRYEHGLAATGASNIRMAEAAGRLAYSRKPETDMEVCSSLQSLASFARGQGVWEKLDKSVRLQQLERMAQLTDELYPTFRWFLFDALEYYAAPYTVFGPQRAVTYMGNMYFVFNSTEHIRILSRHFDNLIRAAVIQPPECSAHIRNLVLTSET